MRSISARAILVVCVLFFSGTAMAKVLIPTNLNQTDREDALRILGFGTSSKILSNPYPMGGYPGFEIGVSVESLPTDDLGRLGDGLETPQQDVSYAKISIGKGLYHGFDVFFQFSPFNQKDGLSQYGGILRWCFFEAESFPLSLSALVHYNSANFDNLVITRSY
ncbi:MAG TPA: hypothetical protein VM432_03255, partial [Bdellovibrionales bacterium]|nr:hypothetical protein [Bdellovibrionales bacterium]